LALAEGAFPSNEGIVRGWSPLWSLYRHEHDARTGRRSRSLLWNLWRQESGPEGTRHGVFFGLVRWGDATPVAGVPNPASRAPSISPRPDASGAPGASKAPTP
ncbi:MAG: hypothetical protein ACKPAH_14040, partial [Verrucomicrobiota bacterium]